MCRARSRCRGWSACSMTSASRYPNAGSCQGNRVKNSCGDETCEEIIVPSGHFALQPQAIFAWGSTDQVVGHVLERDEIGGSMIGAHAAFIVAEDHVHDPVEAILDT